MNLTRKRRHDWCTCTNEMENSNRMLKIPRHCSGPGEIMKAVKGELIKDSAFAKNK